MTDRQNEIILKIQNDTASEQDVYELYQSVRGFCLKIARQYGSLLRCPDEIDDLLQEAYFAIRSAATSYNPDSGASFLTYLVFYLRRTYEAYIARSSGIAINTVQKRYSLKRYENEFAHIWRRSPTDEEICKYFGIGPKELELLRNGGTSVSVDQEINNQDGLKLIDTLAAPGSTEDTVVEAIVAEEVSSCLRRYLDALPHDRRRAAYLFYVYNRTDKECAKRMNLSVSAFRQLRQKALKQLRSYDHLRELGRYLPERIGSVAYARTDRSRWQSSTEKAAFMSIHQELLDEAHVVKKDSLYHILKGR